MIEIPINIFLSIKVHTNHQFKFNFPLGQSLFLKPLSGILQTCQLGDSRLRGNDILNDFFKGFPKCLLF